MRLIRLRLGKRSESGFVLPTVIVLVSIMIIIAYAAALQANNGLNLVYKQSYIEMARVASKSAIDYAQEQFNNASCGNYTGTTETDLISNSRYRVTFKADVTNTSSDGYTKTIQGTGSVYLPKLSTTAKYVFDIRSEIIRAYALCKTPADFGPTEWLDASDTSKLLKLTTGSTISSQAGLGVLNLITPNDSVEEKVSDGSQGTLSWLSDHLDMNTCDPLLFVLNCFGTQAQKDLYDGIVFQGVTVPKGYTINSATLQVSGANPSGSGGSVSDRIYGLFNTATNPNLPLFTSGGTAQVKSRITNASLRTTAFDDVTTNNIPPGNPVNFDVTNIVQEMVNNANWNSASGLLGFGIQRTSGNGSRKVCKGNLIGSGTCYGKGPKLTVTYTATTPSPSANGDSIFEWDPEAGWGVPAQAAYGNQPVRVDNQINGKTIVRFNNGDLLATLTSALTGKQEMTVFAVIKPSFSTSATDGRIITGMTSTNTNDTTAPGSILPLFRYSGNTGFSSDYSGSVSSYRTNYTCGVACTSTPYIFASEFALDSTSNTITATLKGDGTPAATTTSINPPATPSPYKYSLDELYFGGDRSGSLASGVGANYFNGDYAELIVYDHALTCRQTEAIEEYLRSKWAISASAYTSTCPADEVPTL